MVLKGLGVLGDFGKLVVLPGLDARRLAGEVVDKSMEDKSRILFDQQTS